MWSLAFSSLRFRWLSFVGVFVTVMAAATLVTATGSLLEGGIRGAVPPERLAGADIVVAADQDVSETRGQRRRPGDRRAAPSSSGSGSPRTWPAQVASVAGVAERRRRRLVPCLRRRGRRAGRRAGRDAVARATRGAAPSITPFRLVEGARADRLRRGRDRLRAGQPGRSRCRGPHDGRGVRPHRRGDRHRGRRPVRRPVARRSSRRSSSPTTRPARSTRTPARPTCSRSRVAEGADAATVAAALDDGRRTTSSSS